MDGCEGVRFRARGRWKWGVSDEEVTEGLADEELGWREVGMVRWWQWRGGGSVVCDDLGWKEVGVEWCCCRDGTHCG